MPRVSIITPTKIVRNICVRFGTAFVPSQSKILSGLSTMGARSVQRCLMQSRTRASHTCMCPSR